MDDSQKARIKKAKVKVARYCAYRERTYDEAREKAVAIGLRYDEADELVAELISENFINEERFAKVYVNDKFRLNRWGRRKIVQGLQQKNISQSCITTGLQEIDEEEYLETLKTLIEKKSNSVREEELFIRKRKISNYLIGKGYESDLIWGILNEAL